MPLYEYYCADCEVKFELLRGFAQADDPAACPNCGGENARRAISLFAAVSRGEGGTTKPLAGSNPCGPCSATSCTTCGLK